MPSLIDPALSLAFSMYSNKGVFALLLGSGVSRSAQIPTGWEVMIDLIQKLAALKGENPDPDPAAWYQKTFGKAPDYSELLSAIARSPAERQSLLKAYFEPTDEERRDGVKMPMPAHHAIADLVAEASVRVIITTNFDRLIERALEAKGINPVVISTADAAEGTKPLSHLQCVVIKPNGDYLDSRIKNTAVELGEYPRSMQMLLKQVLDEYGLIICGWSADWDSAMRNLVEGSSNRRFTTYWAARSNLSEIATKLATARQAEILSITDADAFFTDLSEKVKTLTYLDARHPLSAKAAAETVKRYVVDPAARVQLHDLIIRETREFCARLNQENFPQDTPYKPETVYERCKRYEALSEILLAAYPPLVFWGDSHAIELVTTSIQMVANAWQTVPGAFYDEWKRVAHYPALLLTFAAGFAALKTEKFTALRQFLLSPTADDVTRSQPLLLGFPPPRMRLHRNQTGQVLNEVVGFHVQVLLRPQFRDLIPNDRDYLSTFHLFEYLLGLVVVHLTNGRNYWPTFLAARDLLHESPSHLLDEQIARNDVPLLKGGFFDGSLDKLKEAKTVLDQHLEKYGSEILFSS
jgi:SIR2-like domain